MSEFIVGLTGGIGSGKSAAATRFAEHGIDIVDADLASRAVVEPGQPALSEIANHFGDELLQPDGSLERAALRQRVFADDAARQWLQRLLHPLINQYLRDHLEQASSPYALLVNPLLVETQQYRWCWRTLVVDVPVELQIERTMARDSNTREQVDNIVRAQASREQRNAVADDIIMNDTTIETLYSVVDEQHAEYLRACQNP